MAEIVRYFRRLVSILHCMRPRKPWPRPRALSPRRSLPAARVWPRRHRTRPRGWCVRCPCLCEEGRAGERLKTSNESVEKMGRKSRLDTCFVRQKMGVNQRLTIIFVHTLDAKFDVCSAIDVTLFTVEQDARLSPPPPNPTQPP